MESLRIFTVATRHGALRYFQMDMAVAAAASCLLTGKLGYSPAKVAAHGAKSNGYIKLSDKYP